MTYYITHSGRRIDLELFSEDDICLDDIAQHLTKICRYGAALPFNTHYSVASHCMYLVKYAQREGFSKDLQRLLLMHDAAEAYLGDIVSGLKHLLPDYKKIESHVEGIIYNKYGITCSEISISKAMCKALDTRILLDEAYWLMPDHEDHFREQLIDITPLSIIITSDLDLDYTKQCFLEMCKQLNIGD